MSRVPSLVALVLAASVTGCVAQSQAEPDYATSPDPAQELGQSDGPTYEGYQQASEPTYSGPPGGAIDAEWQYNNGGYAAPQPGVAEQAYVDPNNTDSYYAGAADPNAPQGYDPAQSMGTVTDAEIDTTLQPYGEWVEDPEYGQMWRPYTTVVGSEFTPYETCGSWVWTEFGWTYNCSWDWGWLPFHYGSWVMGAGGWGWIRDYTWGPAWVDWRYGNDYIGWRPRGPRGGRYLGRPTHEGHWSFNGTRDFGRGAIRPRSISVAAGIRNTVGVERPPVRGNRPIRAADVMGGRRWANDRNPPRVGATNPRPRPGFGQGQVAPRPGMNSPGQRPYRPDLNNHVSPNRPTQNSRPGWNNGTRPPVPSQQWNRPNNQQWSRPANNGPRDLRPYANRNPGQPTYNRPPQGYNRPQNFNRPSGPQGYNRPSAPQGYNRPSSPSGYSRPSAPSRPTYSAPSRSSSGSSSFSRPSGSSRSSGSFSAPSRSSGGSFGGSRGGAGGGRRGR